MQSTFDPRRSYRLSKPRTYDSSMTSLVSVPSYTEFEVFSTVEQSPTISKPDTHDTPLTTSEVEHNRRRDSRQKIRAHLFGTGSESGRKESSDEESELRNGNGLADAARGVRDRLSRSTTIASQLPIARRSRSQLNGSQSRPPQPEKVQQELEDSAHMANQIREMAFHDNLAALNHTPSPVSEEMHVDSVCSPIRRRSLLTPGIATRTPNDILRKPPQLQRCQEKETSDCYFNPMLPESPTLSRLAALDLANNGRFSPVPRSSTPSDLDYTHLGRLKLGTLRITNGSESPLPGSYSPSNRNPSRELGRKDEPQVPIGEIYSKNEKIIPVTRSGNGHSTDLTKKHDSINVRKDEVGRPSRLSVNASVKYQRTATPSKFRRPKSNPLSSDESLKQTLTKPKSQKKRSKSLSAPHSRSHDHAAGIAKDYISELPSSPFALKEDLPAAKPETKATPLKNTVSEEIALQDEPALASPLTTSHRKWDALLDDAETRHSVGGSSRCDLLFLEGSSPSSSNLDTNSRSVSPSITSDAEHVSGPETIRSVMSVSRTADSGYGSSTSLQTLTAPVIALDRAGSKLRPVLKSIGLTARRLSGPHEIPRQPNMSNDALQNLQSYSNTSRLDFSLQSSSEKTITIASSCSSTSQSFFDIRKLKSLRRSSQPLLITVQSNQDLNSSSIPSVPSDVATKHAERLQKFPLLEHTFPTLHNTDSRDGALTPDLTFIPIIFPSPAHAPDDAYSHINVNMNYAAKNADDKTSNYRSSRRRSIFASMSQRKSSRQTEPGDCDLTTIADFGTVTESLGGSPYDIARITHNETRKLTENEILSHPHQMSTATPRAMCMAGMDDCHAAELTRLRGQHRSRSLSRPRVSSRDRSDGILGGRPRPRSLVVDIPPLPALPPSVSQKFPNNYDGVCHKKARPRSMIVEPSPKLVSPPSILRRSFNDRGGIPGKMPKPRSIFVPPVPALPTADEVKQKEAEAQRSKSLRSHTLAPPHRSGGFIQPSEPERENDKAIGTTELSNSGQTQDWDTYRQAWSQRRKSAGNRLLNKTQMTEAPDSPVLDCQPTSDTLTPRPEVHRRPHLNATQYLSVPKQASRSFHIPWTPPSSLPTSQSDSRASIKGSGVPAGHVERLTGRFDG
ncbi:MAG: hypothetical protein Q9187_006060, partial [Circinaria calcarea]